MEKRESEEFEEIIENLINNETVQKMKDYRQHFDTSCFEHCYDAAYGCYVICKKLGLDYKSATRAAMLHDLFLYDWREKSTAHKLHAFHHGRKAFENASEIFELNEIEKDMIIKHMWPVTPRLPKYKETYILTIVDKFCACKEIIPFVFKRLVNRKSLRYVTLILTVLIVKLNGE